MNQPAALPKPARRQLAIAIWTMLVVSTVFVSLESSFAVSVVLGVGVAFFNSVALILMEGYAATEKRQTFQRHFPFLASILIAAVWAVFLGWHNSGILTVAIAIVGMLPVAMIWLTLDAPAPSFIANDRILVLTTHTEDNHEPLAPFATDSCDGPVSAGEGLRIADNSVSASNVTQWLTRSRTIDGESIEGGVCIEFAKDQREATIHVSFCPPLQSTPELTTQDLDAANLEIRGAAIFPFGVRLTVRRSVNSNATVTYRIGFVAISASVRRVA